MIYNDSPAVFQAWMECIHAKIQYIIALEMAGASMLAIYGAECTTGVKPVRHTKQKEWECVIIHPLLFWHYLLLRTLFLNRIEPHKCNQC